MIGVYFYNFNNFDFFCAAAGRCYGPRVKSFTKVPEREESHEFEWSDLHGKGALTSGS